MERRLPGQTVERWRSDRMEEFTPIARRCARWGTDHHVDLAEADPDIPAGLHDRAADNWRPLFAIADRSAASGPRWHERPRWRFGRGQGDVYGVMLLEDIRVWWLLRNELRPDGTIGMVFKEEPPLEMASSAIVEAMKALEDRPWARPLNVQKLASLLRPFGIAPTRREYKFTTFDQPWPRYLPPWIRTSVSIPATARVSAKMGSVHDISARTDPQSPRSQQRRGIGTDVRIHPPCLGLPL